MHFSACPHRLRGFRRFGAAPSARVASFMQKFIMMILRITGQ
jgi:hypothetical protein